MKLIERPARQKNKSNSARISNNFSLLNGNLKFHY